MKGKRSNMTMILKNVGFGLMIVYVGIVGVGVFLYYILNELFEKANYCRKKRMIGKKRKLGNLIHF